MPERTMDAALRRLISLGSRFRGDTAALRIAVIGAGAIGGYIAAELHAGGAEVSLIGRAGADGAPVRASNLTGRDIRRRPDLVTTSGRGSLLRADLAVVTVKSRDTLDVASELAEALPPGCPVVSLGNGLDQKARLASRLGQRVVGGFVSYNVFVDAEGVRRQTTKGKVFLEQPHAFRALVEKFVRHLEAGGERVDVRRDIEAALAGKLLLNLQNGICAATGLSLAELFADADARRCFSLSIREGLRIFKEAGIRPARVTALPAGLVAWGLLLPDAIASPLAARVSKASKEAKTSTLVDIERGRASEIDDLNGAVVSIARSLNLSAPCNAAVRDAVREIEARPAADRVPFLTSRELLRRMTSRTGGPSRDA